MEADCKRALSAGGQPIALLPDAEWQTINDYVTIPLATGIGPARNALLARSSRVLIAVRGGYGTLSEMTYGLHFGRLVIGLEDAPQVDGLSYYDAIDAAITHMCKNFLSM